MKNRVKLLFTVAFTVLITLPALSQQKLLIAGSGWKEVAIVDRTSGKVEWTHPIDRATKGEDCNDIEMTRSGDILIACKTAARLVTKEQRVLWEYAVAPGEEVNTATELPKGGFMLGVCGIPARIVTLDKAGKVVREITFDTEIANTHSQFRQVTATKKGTYIVPLMARKEIIELSDDGKVLRRVKLDAGAFSVKVTKDGLWMASCGDAHKIEFINPKSGEPDRVINADDVEGVKMLFVGEIEVLPNGNLLVCNWNGHSKDKNQPKLYELDKQNNVVWTLPALSNITNISAVSSVR